MTVFEAAAKVAVEAAAVTAAAAAQTLGNLETKIKQRWTKITKLEIR